MKTMKIICVLAVVATLASCAKSSNDAPADSGGAPAGQAGQQSTATLRLNNNETTVASAVAFVSAGYVTAYISSQNTLTCDSLLSGSMSSFSESYVVLGFPEKVVDYGTLDLGQLVSNRISIGFNLGANKIHVVSKAKFHVQEVTAETITIDIDSISKDAVDQLKGTVAIAICRR